MLPLIIAAVGSILVGASLRGDAIGSNILKQAKNEPAYHIEGQELVSVVIPTYYEGDYIEDALESIRHQTYTPIEIIVSDETQEIEVIDETRQFADEYDAELVHMWAKNVALGRNHGAEIATGDILLFLDADCIMANDYVEKLITDLNYEGVRLAYGFDVYDVSANVLRQAGRVMANYLTRPLNFTTGHGVAMRAADFWEVGGYNADLDPMIPGQHEDVDLGQRVEIKWGRPAIIFDKGAFVSESARRPSSSGAATWSKRAYRKGKAID